MKLFHSLFSVKFSGCILTYISLVVSGIGEGWRACTHHYITKLLDERPVAVTELLAAYKTRRSVFTLVTAV